MIDLHCHPLPGVDDGPSSQQSALELIRSAAATGTRTIVATPHVSAAYAGTNAAGVQEAVRALQASVDEAGIAMRILAGAEVELLHCESLSPGELEGLRLGDSPYTLVELPFSADGRFVEMLLGVHREVHPVLLAHPERCRAFHDDRDLLRRLVEQGALAQITAASFCGTYGSLVRTTAWRMLEDGLVHVVASDAHDSFRRPPQLREPLELAGLADLVTTLCKANPAAILAGERPAAAPASTPRRSVRPGRLLAALRGR